MRKLLFAATIIAGSTFLQGCEELENLCGIKESDLKYAEGYTKHLNEAIYIYKQVDRSMRDSVLEVTGSNVIDGATCTRTADSLIIDYGTGTICADGLSRSGIIRLGFTGNYMTSSSTAGIVLSNYRQSEMMFTGSMAISNLTGGTQPNFNLSINEFTADTLELNASFQTEWLSGFDTKTNFSDDALKVTGSTSLEYTSNTESVTGTITSPVLIDASCQYTFVEGVISLVPVNSLLPEVGLDFIDGDCSNIFQAEIGCQGDVFKFSFPIK
jgi:hypothetical protein